MFLPAPGDERIPEAGRSEINFTAGARMSEDIKLHHYEVGKPCVAGRTSWSEAAEYNYRAGQHELRLFWRHPMPAEIQAVKHGRVDFALLVEKDIIFLLFRFGNAVPWSEAPYSWHLVKRKVPGEADLPEPHGSSEGRDLLTIILVNAATGIIEALRVVSWSPAFSAALRLAIRDQAARPWPGDVEHQRQLNNAYRRWPTSAAMVRDATSRTRGGA